MIGEMLPVAEAAFRAGVSRERAVRAVQRKLVEGELRDGRWFVRLEDLLSVGRSAAEVVRPSGRSPSGR